MKESACLKQIRYWDKALREAQKAIRRRNKLIARLRIEISTAQRLNRELMVQLAESQEKET